MRKCPDFSFKPSGFNYQAGTALELFGPFGLGTAAGSGGEIHRRSSWGKGKPETEVVVAIRRVVVVTVSRPAVIGIVVPAAAAINTVRAL